MLYAGFEEMDAQKWGRDVPARAQYMFGAGAAMVIMALCVWAIPDAPAAEQPTITIFAGRAVSNSITDVHSNAWGIEQETPTRYGMLNFGYMNEGHQRGDKRDGIYAMREFNYQFAKHVETSFAIGPYFTATTQTAANGIDYQDHYSWAALAGASAKYHVDGHWSLMARWNHVLYAAHNKDADVFLIGVGYSPTKW